MFTTKGSPVALEPQPFVATQSGAAGEAPSTAKPIALYGVEGGGGGVELPIDLSDIVISNPQDGSTLPFEATLMHMFEAVGDDSVTISIRDPHEEGAYFDDTRPVSDWLGFLYGMIDQVNTDLTVRVVRLETNTFDLEGRIQALEAAAE